MNRSSESPIFIVGTPRSGTTLLATMLSGHSRIDCGPETQFFNKLRPQDLQDAVEDKHWPRKALRLLASLTLADQKVHEIFGISDADLVQHLWHKERSVQTIFQALTALHAERAGKARWAEKTPNHLLHLPFIRELYPDAPVIRIVRDPRDAALSMNKLPWASNSVLTNCFIWNEWFEKSHEFFARDPLTLTVFYEALALRPEAELRKICAFVGEPFELEMLNVEKVGKKLTSPKETWKDSNKQALHTQRVYAWKNEMTADMQKVSSIVCWEGIKAFNYDNDHSPAKTVSYFPLTRRTLELNEAFVIRSALSGTRIQRAPRFRLGRTRLFIPGMVDAFRLLAVKKLRPMVSFFRTNKNRSIHLS